MIAEPVPVFIISFNRGDWLRRCVAACRKLLPAVDMIIHDNGSDDPSTLRCLELFEAEGIAVVRRGKIRDSAELNQVNDTIARYFTGRAPAPYVVTDCDIDISIARPDALGVYNELLDMFPDAPCVGPMIRIRDVPRHYPLFTHVIEPAHRTVLAPATRVGRHEMGSARDTACSDRYHLRAIPGGPAVFPFTGGHKGL